MKSWKRCSMHARPVVGGVTFWWHITGADEVVYLLLLLSPKQPQIKEIQSSLSSKIMLQTLKFASIDCRHIRLALGALQIV